MKPLIPESFSAMVTGRAPEPHISGDAWLLQLPGLVEASLAEWDLTLDGYPMHGVCALVVPVRLGDSSAAVLKVTWPHVEAAHEHLALQRWGGRGAVRLLAANPGRWAMLLERLDGDHDLQDVPIDEACRVIGGLLRQLDHPALPRLSRLSAEAARLVERLDSAPQAIPRRFVEQARAVLSDLMTDEAIDSCMVHTDLHYGNVLAADRQPWLAIDPKPICGGTCAVAWRSSVRPPASMRNEHDPGRSRARCRWPYVLSRTMTPASSRRRSRSSRRCSRTDLSACPPKVAHRLPWVRAKVVARGASGRRCRPGPSRSPPRRRRPGYDPARPSSRQE